jgi:hypothetical protein
LLPQWLRAGAVLQSRQSNSIFAAEALGSSCRRINRKTTLRLRLKRSIEFAAALLLPIALAACMTDDDSVKSISYTSDRGVADQPFPANYRPELLAFLKTYINNPAGIRNAVIAEPAQRSVGGRQRYVVCVKYSARDSDGNYRDPRDHALVYVDGRLDHIVDKSGELCAGAVYAAFPELEKLTR